MRSRSALLNVLVNVLGLAILVGGCGTGTVGLVETPPDMAVVPDIAVTPPDLSVQLDMTVLPDLTQPLFDPDANGIACGALTCPMGQVCCISGIGGGGGTPMTSCAASCGEDGGTLTVACDGPESCPGGNPCCAQIMGAALPKSISCSAQPTDCFPQISLQPVMGMDRLCHIDADCTRDAPMTTLSSCCTITYGGQGVHLCFNKGQAALAGIIGLKVTCP